MALALVFRMIATSVLNRKERINWPNTRMPVHSPMISGTVTIDFLNRLPKVGISFIADTLCSLYTKKLIPQATLSLD
jgi:hypothetical protein